MNPRPQNYGQRLSLLHAMPRLGNRSAAGNHNDRLSARPPVPAPAGPRAARPGPPRPFVIPSCASRPALRFRPARGPRGRPLPSRPRRKVLRSPGTERRGNSPPEEDVAARWGVGRRACGPPAVGGSCGSPRPYGRQDGSELLGDHKAGDRRGMIYNRLWGKVKLGVTVILPAVEIISTGLSSCSLTAAYSDLLLRLSVALGRNQPLKKEKPKWKSDYPMTDGQLRSKRDEFWDTAPAFEGRKEIWDALKAAAHAFESNDHELAQAIIDGANITLPHGALTECYDELGNRYQLPVYCLAPPINMIEEKSDIETLDIPEPPPNSGYECQLRLRLSTGKDLKLVVRSTDTVYHMKRRLHAAEGVEPSSQRWFFSGRPLTDKMKLEELKIPKDYVVQVIMSQPLQNPTPVEN
nr:ubiquitin domain-containing protein 2 [Vulpes vulpes]